jgi:WD40 repeat protein
MMRSVFCFLWLGLFAGPAFAGPADNTQQLLYFATWPHQVVVFDAVQEKIVDQINLNTDIAQLLVLSADKKKLYASTVRDNSIVTIDLKTRKPVDSFPLNTGNQNVRLLGLAPDPTGKYLYSIGSTVIKQMDHYDVEPPKLFLIDLENHKISRSVDFPKDESLVGFWRIQMKFSPDGKYFYMFLGNILVFDSSSLQLVKKIELGDPHVPGFANVVFNPVEEEPAEDPNEEPGKLTNVFMASDPYVYRSVFGIAKIDLATLSFDFSPVAPVTTLSMTPLLLTPDHQAGYTIAIDGSPGNRRCEFWVFDMKTRKLVNKKEFAGRNRFSFGLSADGTKIFIYGAGFEINVYDAKTLEFRRNVTLPGDMTSNIIVMPAARQSVAERTPGISSVSAR